MRHPLGFAGHVHYLTHHVREQGTLRLEEAIRKMTSMPAAHFGLWDRGLLRAGYSADVVVFDWDELDDVSTTEQPPVYARGVEHVLVNGETSSTARRTPAPVRGVNCSAGRPDGSTSAPTCTRFRPRRCGRRCASGAGLGDLRRGPVGERVAAARGRPARQGSGDLGAHLRDGEPRRTDDSRAARQRGRARGRVPRPQLGGDGDQESQAWSPGRSGPTMAGSTRRRWRSSWSRPARRCSCSRTPTPVPAARCCGPS